MQFHRTIIAPAALDPFGQFGNRAARRHPRRDPNPQAHPQNPAVTPPAPTVDPATPPTATPPAAPAAPAQDDWAKTFEGKTPAEVLDALNNSRRWETRAKENHPKALKYDEILAGLTGTGGDTPPDPAKLATDLTASQREVRETKVENAILLLAPTKGANPGSLIDSRSFMDKIKSLNLDPAASDFAEKLTAEIDTVAASHPLTAIPRGPLPNPQQGNPGHQKTESNVSAGRARYKERNSK